MRRTGVALLVAVLLALVVSGCGEKQKSDGVASLGSSSGDGDGDDKGKDGKKDSDLSPEDAAMEFAKCMRENGVDMPDPVIDEDGGMTMRMEAGVGDDLPDQETQEKAMKACEQFMGDVRSDFSEEDRSKMEDQFLEFAKCMRENGVDMPDPDTSGEGGGAFRLEVEDQETFEKAQEACKEFAPGMIRSEARG